MVSMTSSEVALIAPMSQQLGRHAVELNAVRGAVQAPVFDAEANERAAKGGERSLDIGHYTLFTTC
ncbi:MAG: hypothetical protein M3Q13_02495 [Pseudomonadota bacterium]|nr:hypothetical protein [Pseudomonadota bacterium]